MKLLALSMIAALTVAPALAQEDYFVGEKRTLIQIDLGWTDPDTSSDIYDFSQEQLTFDPDDMDGFQVNIHALRQLNNIVSVGGGVNFFGETVDSEDRLYEFEDGSPIRQETSLRTAWFGAVVVVTPFGAGETFGSHAWTPHIFVPYIQVGAGILNWEFTQEGEFTDAATLDVFFDSFEDDGVTAGLHGSIGFRLNLTKNVDINFKYSHQLAEDDIGGDFEGFGELDLGSDSFFAGMVIRI